MQDLACVFCLEKEDRLFSKLDAVALGFLFRSSADEIKKWPTTTFLCISSSDYCLIEIATVDA